MSTSPFPDFTVHGPNVYIENDNNEDKYGASCKHYTNNDYCKTATSYSHLIAEMHNSI